jgi:hypothetical protein
VNGVALDELRRSLRGREHILVGGEVFERPGVDHSSGGGQTSSFRFGRTLPG